MKKKRWLIILIIVAIILVIVGFIAKDFLDKTDAALEELKNTTFAEINLNEIPDGNYKGYFKQFPVEVELVTTVKDGAISKIDIIKHVNGQGKDGEKVTSSVIKKQSLEVDTITGATYSSLVILKAIEDALLDIKK